MAGDGGQPCVKVILEPLAPYRQALRGSFRAARTKNNRIHDAPTDRQAGISVIVFSAIAMNQGPAPRLTIVDSMSSQRSTMRTR